MNLQPCISVALWLAGIGHFCILGASFQVPGRLGWKEDLAKLTPFNRKLMWVYGGTTLLTIVAFGMLTLFLHDDFLRGDRAALALAAFIALFWTIRIIVDFTYFKHSDWPSGPQFVAGHFLLTTLFAALASTYWAVLIWNLMKGGA
jgi:UDP-N-acetylmuramyl pentapeptide phosphotransferase/UDP-N-acetylglucosamine-1-phosphate transferase